MVSRPMPPAPGFPEPHPISSEPNALEGTIVTVTCAAETQALVTLDGIPRCAPDSSAQLQLNATENDDRRGFFCDATLEVDGETLSKNRSVELRVLCECYLNLSLPSLSPPLLLVISRAYPDLWPYRGSGGFSHV